MGMDKEISSQAASKRCSKCRETKPIDQFVFRKSKQRFSSRCRGCISHQNREYYEQNREVVKAQVREYYWKNREKVREYDNAYHKKRYQNLKREIVDAYGGRCACCGELEIIFLTVDHIEENGAYMRRNKLHPTGTQFFQWLKNQEYPDGFQILCYNCNMAKHRNGGVCPHQEAEGSETRT